ncbi:Major facilitator superfamily domain, general substrate transporter [Metarhizium album ARSEF 1941]|uniref:Major facilitator superfamily domain, general substrate transporter n=1 Tax=Metarhizium album (strain ARSEF 1941) TaxID=1081103 RepID=A0A0B2WSY5_METAS|nr:Major facilitator superfamily domain, general substrate transporter [Metarhizium album ARSEF 1941]KHN99181.1 Major facilitator superfamily domain, general substrate transporter [Metarhizium album ARSEF 1941]
MSASNSNQMPTSTPILASAGNKLGSPGTGSTGGPEEVELRRQSVHNGGIQDPNPLDAPGPAGRGDRNYTVISWDVNDAENPHHWSFFKKTYILTLTCMLVTNSTMSSALPSMIIPQIIGEFGSVSQEQQVLPISVFLLGYVFGPVVWAPLSEQFGRKHLTTVTFLAFSIFTMASALSPSWSSLLAFRLCSGIFASAPIAVVAGILADIYGDARVRGKAYSAFLVTTVFGPIFGPIVSGFVAPTIGWRWAFWIALLYAALTFIMLLFLPETHHQVLLARRAKRLRQQSQSVTIVAPRDLETIDLPQLVSKVLTRPLRMLFFEPIVATTCSYLALAYAIFYMSFQAFPIIFSYHYALPPGITGLCYLPIGAGAFLSMVCFWCWDAYVARASSRGAAWPASEEYRRVPLATVGGPLFVISLFWLGFTTRPGISFVVPMLAGLPFGMGFQLIFMTLLNYLTDAYEVYAASANAAASATRSCLAVVLPLATKAMFNQLGVSGACAVLGGLSAAMSVIPFVFLCKGQAIRNKSPFCIALRREKEDLLRKEEQRRLDSGKVANGTDDV